MKKILLFLIIPILILAQSTTQMEHDKFIRDEEGGTFISTMPFGLSVSAGYKPGYSYIVKFAENPIIDTTTDPEDIWDYGGLYTFTVDSGANYYFSSSAVADSQAFNFYVMTVDSNDNWNTETILDTLQGRTKQSLTSASGDSIVRIYRIENESDFGDDLAGILYVYENSAVVDGVPSTASKVKAIIDDGNNQTLMSQYCIPTGYVGFFVDLTAGVSRSVTGGAARGSIKTRRYGKLFKVKGRVDFVNAGSSNYYGPEVFPQPLPAKTDINLTIEEVTANAMGVYARYTILLVEEDKFPDSYLTAIGQIKRVE